MKKMAQIVTKESGTFLVKLVGVELFKKLAGDADQKHFGLLIRRCVLSETKKRLDFEKG